MSNFLVVSLLNIPGKLLYYTEKIILCQNRFYKICLLPIRASIHELHTQRATGTHIRANTLIHSLKKKKKVLFHCY